MRDSGGDHSQAARRRYPSTESRTSNPSDPTGRALHDRIPVRHAATTLGDASAQVKYILSEMDTLR